MSHKTSHKTSDRAARLAIILVSSLGLTAASRAGEISLWAVDPHVKVFRHTEPPAEPGKVTIRAARNEYEPGQIAFRSATPAKEVRVELSPLRHAESDAAIVGQGFTWNYVGFIPLKHNTRGSERIRVCTAPCEVPDPLLEDRTIDVAAGATQPVWLTVRVPEDAEPGVYRGRAVVVAGEQRAAVPVELTVEPFTLPEARHLLVTNWFHTERIARYHDLEPWSEPFWELLGRYAENMAAHRQNVVYVPWRLIRVSRLPDGKLEFDYRQFDRFVELFDRAGVADRVEIAHVGHFGPGGYSGKEIVLTEIAATDRQTGRQIRLAPRQGLVPLLADLERRLARRGWLQRSMIHVADEPSLGNVASWREASALVHQAAPRLRRIDAIETVDFSGHLEVWVPKLTHFDRWRDAYEARRSDGEFWYYICCHPVGNYYPNRFMDYPTTRVRVLHWINFTEQLAGYLHWGLDSWREDAFGPPLERYGPGDTHAVYPGRRGPLNSIRWEIQRESIEDFEYLHLLTAKTAELKTRLGRAAEWVRPRRRAMELARRVVPAIAETETDPARIMAVRRQVAAEIAGLARAPLLLVETEPPAGSTLFEGPIVVELRGLSRPGAVVRVNGRAVDVDDEGRFCCRTRPDRQDGEIRVEAEADGEKKTAVRRFQVRG